MAEFLRSPTRNLETMIQAYHLIGDGDAINYGSFWPYALSYDFMSKVRVPGVDLPEDDMWQVVETDLMKREDYDKGFLFGKRFTDAAKKELMRNDIQRISEGYMPTFKPERLYLQINNYVNDLCKEKCGKIPKKEADCKGNCRVRVISDNASFHFEQGWINLMKKDLKQLLVLSNSKKSD